MGCWVCGDPCNNLRVAPEWGGAEVCCNCYHRGFEDEDSDYCDLCNELYWDCDLCDKSFPSIAELEEHHEIAHSLDEIEVSARVLYGDGGFKS